jgi:hypothetical protein
MRPLGCLIGRHEWTSRVEQGERYKVCTRCGAEPRRPRGEEGRGTGRGPGSGEGPGGDGDGGGGNGD